MNSFQSITSEPKPYLYAYGITPSIPFRSTLTFSNGQCRDSNNNMDIIISNNTLVDLKLNGIGGLDTGTATGNTMYAYYAIGDSTNKKPSGMMASLASNASPVLPRGYDSYRLMNYWATGSGSSVRIGDQIGNGNYRIFEYDDFSSFIPLVNGNSTALSPLASVNLSSYIPPVSDTFIYLNSQFQGASLGDTANINNFSTVAAGGIVFEIIYPVSTGPWYDSTSMNCALVSGVPTIYYSVSNSGDSLTLYLTGFKYFI